MWRLILNAAGKIAVYRFDLRIAKLTLKKLVSAFIAIPFAVILYRILRKIIIRRFYREKKDASANSTH